MKKKRCTKCGEVKPLTDYHRNKSKHDGRETWCKTCKNAYNTAYARGMLFDARLENRIPSIERKYHCITCGMGHDTECEAALCCDYKAKL